MNKLKITLGESGLGRIEVDGQHIKKTRRFTLTSRAGETPRLLVETFATEADGKTVKRDSYGEAVLETAEYGGEIEVDTEGLVADLQPGTGGFAAEAAAIEFRIERLENLIVGLQMVRKPGERPAEFLAEIEKAIAEDVEQIVSESAGRARTEGLEHPAFDPFPEGAIRS